MTEATSRPPLNREPRPESWLDQVTEEIIDPDRPIIDPHHHLWIRPWHSYLVDNLWADTETGHNIIKTVFIECRAAYRKDGPEELRSLGETEFAAEQAEASINNEGKPEIAGIVAFADLRAGAKADELLEAHKEAARGRLRGIRHPLAFAHHPEILFSPGRREQEIYSHQGFREGLKLLGRMGLVYDSWHYHYQNREFAELARSAPDTVMVLDHFGTPLGVGPYAGKQDEIFRKWKEDIAEIAVCENTIAKIGGLAMPDNGFGWDQRDRPASSDELVVAQRPYYMHAIECFGPDRCMLESNFPVDRRSISYPVLYNALKKLVADFSEDEKDMMFRGTAERVYRI
jgi:predicted TIM-barrel fold metal-dependent hydrolase